MSDYEDKDNKGEDKEDKRDKDKDKDKEDKDNDENKRIRVVAAIDFGTTFSGFAYAYKTNEDKIFVHSDWQEYAGRYYKTPTVIKYEEDKGSFNLKSWGYSALAEPPVLPNNSDKKKKKKKEQTEQTEQIGNTKIAERFKLHLCNMENKPYLPDDLDYKTAIVDYLREIGKVMKETLKRRCQNLDFFDQVLIVMTVPVEFKNRALNTLRECALNAEIINRKQSPNLKFTYEPEAAAVNCMNILKDLDVGVGNSFMIVDCGGGTVDLTTRKLLEDQKLGEITEAKGYYYGGSFVDDEFIKFLGSKVGSSAIEQLREKNYCRLQYMVQEFCRRVKFPFTGQKENFKPFDLDLEELWPDIKQYVESSKLDEMEEEEWTIKLKFDDVKKMFDPVVVEILDSISKHLDASNNDVSAILLVGGFSESKYLQERVKQKFNRKLQNKISFPENPVIAVVEGAVQYGLRQEVISTRVLKRTYGTDVARKWVPGDPIERKHPGGAILEFSQLAERGDAIPVNAAIPRIFTPGCILQRKMGLDIYITDEKDAKYCDPPDPPDVKLLGKWCIDLPITLSERPILFLLIFGELEISAAAFNLETGDMDEITFEFNEEF